MLSYCLKRSVIHCRGHQKGEDKIAKGNKVADKAAKRTAMQEYTAGPLLWERTLLPLERPQYQSEESKSPMSPNLLNSNKQS
jgi:hypothetical protein